MTPVDAVISRLLGIWWRSLDPTMGDTLWFWDGREGHHYSRGRVGPSSFTVEQMDAPDSGYERVPAPRFPL